MQIDSSVTFLGRYVDNSNGALDVRLYNLPLIGRILITDDFAYLTPYSHLAHSRASRVLKFRRGGDMFGFLERIFNEAWETGVSPWNKESIDAK
jgi:hypothetical protein